MTRVLFGTSVVLTGRDTFDALEACARAERALLRVGAAAEAAAIATLFELLEDRLTYCVGSSLPATAGSNSSESEFTQ